MLQPSHENGEGSCDHVLPGIFMMTLISRQEAAMLRNLKISNPEKLPSTVGFTNSRENRWTTPENWWETPKVWSKRVHFKGWKSQVPSLAAKTSSHQPSRLDLHTSTPPLMPMLVVNGYRLLRGRLQLSLCGRFATPRQLGPNLRNLVCHFCLPSLIAVHHQITSLISLDTCL